MNIQLLGKIRMRQNIRYLPCSCTGHMMDIIRRNNLNQKPDIVRSLTNEESVLLHRMWEGHPDEKNRAGELIARIHGMKAWVACDCGDPGYPPVLTPVEYEPNKFTLRRNSSRPRHGDCVFVWEEGELGRSQKKIQIARTTRDLPDFILLRSLNLSALQHDGIGRKSECQPPRSANQLAGMLFWLLERAGLDQIYPPYPEKPWDRITSIAKCITVHDGLTLADMFMSPQALMDGTGKTKLLQLLHSGKWPKKIPLQGFILTLIHTINEHELNTKQGIVQVTGDLKIYGGSIANGPWLAMIAVRYNRVTKAMEAYQAYAHPATSFGYHLVDAHTEREAINTIIWAGRRAQEKNHGTIEAEKPLTPLYPNGIASGCRPDFILRLNGCAMVVETMGNDNADYLEYKKSFHDIMQQIGPLYLDERADGNHKEANSRLASTILRWAKQAGRIQVGEQVK